MRLPNLPSSSQRQYLEKGQDKVSELGMATNKDQDQDQKMQN